MQLSKVSDALWPVHVRQDEPTVAAPAPTAAPGWGRGQGVDLDRRRQALALLLSLLMHSILLGLTLGGEGVGLPGLVFPWQERRVEVPELHARLMPERGAAAELAIASAAQRLPPTPAAAQTATGGVAPVPAMAAPAPERAAVAVVSQAQAVTEASLVPVLAVVPSAPSIPEPMIQSLPMEKINAAAVRTQPEMPRPTDEEPLPDRTEPDKAQTLEAARLESQRREIALLEAARQEETQQEAARVEASRQEADRQELARAEATRLDAIRQDAAQQEVMRIEALRQQAARQEAAGVDTARKEAARQDAVLAEAARQEAERKQAALKETARQDEARAEAARQEAARAEATRQEIARQEAARIEATRQEAARQDAARTDATRLEAERKDAERKDAAAKREARLQEIGRQLNEEADRRAAAAAHKDAWASSQRRGRLFGRSDLNAELVLYAEALARKIQMNTTMELFQELAKQPHTQPVVTVAIRSDGSVESVVFVRASGVAAIDEAISRIVRSHANYPAFPPGLIREYDVIEIRRTWVFDTAVRLQ